MGLLCDSCTFGWKVVRIKEMNLKIMFKRSSCTREVWGQRRCYSFNFS